MTRLVAISAEAAEALAAPVPWGIVTALNGRSGTVGALSQQLAVDESVVLAELLALERMGLVQAIDAATQEYGLVRDPVAWEAAWDQLPVPLRRTAAAATIEQVHAEAASAVDAGGFDRPDMFLTRSRMNVTEEAWSEISALLGATLRRLGNASAEAATDAQAPRVPATAVLMLFTDRHVEPPPAAAVDQRGDETLERMYSIVEALEAVVSDEATEWARVEELAGELFVRAATYLQARR